MSKRFFSVLWIVSFLFVNSMSSMQKRRAEELARISGGKKTIGSRSEEFVAKKPPRPTTRAPRKVSPRIKLKEVRVDKKLLEEIEAFLTSIIYVEDEAYQRKAFSRGIADVVGSVKIVFPSISEESIREVFKEALPYLFQLRQAKKKEDAFYHQKERELQSGEISEIPLYIPPEEDEIPNFSWCICMKASEEMRFYLIFCALSDAVCRLRKSKRINYLSLGSGELLQDYLMIKGLIKLGFKKISVNVVDADYIRESELYARKALTRLKNLLKGERGVQINSYINYDTFLKRRRAMPVDLLFLVDYPDVGMERIAKGEVILQGGKKLQDGEYICPTCIIESGEFRFAEEFDYGVVDVKSQYEKANYAGMDIKVKVKLASENGIVRKFIFFLPYKGMPELFYKSKKAVPPRLLKVFREMASAYRDYRDRSSFFRALRKNFGFRSKLIKFLKRVDGGVPEIKFSAKQSLSFGYHDTLREACSKNSLVYLLDEGKIFIGFTDLNARKYEKNLRYKKIRLKAPPKKPRLAGAKERR